MCLFMICHKWKYMYIFTYICITYAFQLIIRGQQTTSYFFNYFYYLFSYFIYLFYFIQVEAYIISITCIIASFW